MNSTERLKRIKNLEKEILYADPFKAGSIASKLIKEKSKLNKGK